MNETRGNLRHSVTFSMGLLLAALSVLALALLSAQAQGDELTYVLKDVASLCAEEAASLGPHAGAISSLGIMLWTAASASSLLAGWILLHSARYPREEGWLMLVLGVFSAGAALDDQFQIHERVLPAAGLAQGVYSVLYAGSFLTILVVFRRLLVQHNGLLLLFALCSLGLSTLADMGADYVGGEGTFEAVAEDTLKFVGLVMWTAFVVSVAHWRLKRVIVMGADTPEPTPPCPSPRRSLRN